ncbi:hypothetical protein [Actinomadura rugatobispora]|uniref:Sensor domain-containing protein n=1 Tax=Actinomadura rugatobispora TaxID=1994 RepID=A0ABW1ADS5_9ACTN|nr:hypothetical protein GCM10010200_070580 [Actinomadura rugatobispora]
MSRFVHGPVCVAGVALVAVAGCGGGLTPAEPLAPPGRPTGEPSGRLAGASLLAPADVQGEGFLPAERQDVFTGLRPHDPACARMLALADVRRPDDTRGAPRGLAVFYRSQPPATMAEHLVRLPPGAAGRYITRVRAAVAGCPRIRMLVGPREAVLDRARARRPAGVRDAVAVTYAGRGRGGIDLAMFWARSRDDLLVVAAAGEAVAGPSMQRIAARAVHRLQDEHARPGR